MNLVNFNNVDPSLLSISFPFFLCSSFYPTFMDLGEIIQQSLEKMIDEVKAEEVKYQLHINSGERERKGEERVSI